MNTKGIKFLAVLAVLAMAFAAVAIVVPAEQDDAATTTPVYDSSAGTIVVDGTTLQKYVAGTTTITAGYSYYFDSDSSITLPADNGSTAPVALYVKNGVKISTKVNATAVDGNYDVFFFAVSSYDSSAGKITLSAKANTVLLANQDSAMYSTSTGEVTTKTLKVLDGIAASEETFKTKHFSQSDNGFGATEVGMTVQWKIEIDTSQEKKEIEITDISTAAVLDSYNGGHFEGVKDLTIRYMGSSSATYDLVNFTGSIASGTGSGAVTINYATFTGTVVVTPNSTQAITVSDSKILMTVSVSNGLTVKEDSSKNITLTGTSATLSTFTVPSGYSLTATAPELTITDGQVAGTASLGAATITKLNNSGTLNISGTTGVSGTLQNASTFNISGAVTFAAAAKLYNTGNVVVKSGSLVIEGDSSSQIGVTGITGSGSITVNSGATLTTAGDGKYSNPIGKALNTNTLVFQNGSTYTGAIGTTSSFPISWSGSSSTGYIQATPNGSPVYSTTPATHPGFTYTIADDVDLNLDFIQPKDIINIQAGQTLTTNGTITIPTGIVINNNGSIVIDGTSVTITLGTKLVNNGTVQVKKTLTIEGSTNAGTTDDLSLYRAGVDGITGTGLVEIVNGGVLAVGVDNGTSTTMLNINDVKIWYGGKYTAMVDSSNAPIWFSDNATEDNYIYASFNSGAYSYTTEYAADGTTIAGYTFVSGPGFTYDICANVTVNWATAFLRSGDIINVQEDYTGTITKLVTRAGSVINNYGTIAGTDLDNYGVFNNYGTVSSMDNLVNETGAEFNNNMYNKVAAEITTMAAVNNLGTFNNAGTITAIATSSFINDGMFINSKTVTSLTNYSGAGIIRNTGTITLGEDLTLPGTIFNEGKFTAGDKNVSILSGAAFEGDLTFTATAKTLTLSAGSGNGGIYAGTIILDADGTANDAQATIAVQAATESFTVTTGSLTFAGMINGTYEGSTIVGDSGDVNIGILTIAYGDVKLDGDLEITNSLALQSATITVAEDAEITLLDGSTVTLDAGSVISIEGTIKEDTTGGASITGTGTIKTASDASLIVNNIASSLAVVDEDGMSDATLSGEVKGYTEFDVDQVVTVSGYCTLLDTANVHIKGKLIIPVGTSLTLEAGSSLTMESSAKIIVYGQLIIEEATSDAAAGTLLIGSGNFSIYGLVQDNGIISLAASQTVEVFEGGVFTIDTEGSMTTGLASEFIVDEGAKMNVFGALEGSTIYNAGEININSEHPATSLATIYQRYDGATINVYKYTVSSNAPLAGLYITDDGYRLYTFRENGTTYYVTQDYTETILISMDLVNGSTPIASDDYSISFGGLTVVADQSSSSTTKANNITKGIYNEKLYTKMMYISGPLNVFYTYIGADTGSSSYTASADVLLGGDKVYIKEGMTVGNNVVVNNAAKLFVSSEVTTSSTTAVIRNTGVIDVSGEGIITSYGQAINSDTNAYMNATKIKISVVDSTGKTVTNHVYMHVDAAIDMLNDDSTLNEATVIGTQTMKKDAELSAGNKLTVSGTLNVGSKTDIDLVIDTGATLNGSGTVKVNGTAYAYNKQNVVTANLTMSSDVYSEEVDAQGKPVKTGWAKWSCLAVALADAEIGDEVKLKQTTTVTSSLTVPNGVTLIIPAAYDLNLDNGVTFTIDGVVVLLGDIMAETGYDLTAQDRTGFYASAIVVNGALMSSANIPYASGTTSNVDGDAATNGYTHNLEGGAPIAGAYYAVKKYKVISGIEVAMDSVSTIQSNITVYGAVNASILDFVATENCEKLIVDGGTYYTKQENPLLIGDVIPTTLKVGILALDGATLVIDNNAAAHGSFTGRVSVGENIVALTGVSSGTTDGFQIYDNSDKLYMKGTAELTDKTGSIMITYGTAYAFPITVNQVADSYVVVDSEATLVINKNTGSDIDELIVYGTVQVPANMILSVDDITVYGTLDIAESTGTTAKGTFNLTGGAMYIGMDEDDYTAALAVVNGPITQITAGSAFFIDAASNVSEQFLEKVDQFANRQTAFYAEGELWFTAYTDVAAYAITVNDTPVANTVLDGWAEELGGSAVKFASNTYYTMNIGEKEELYAVLDYNLYRIVVIADQGVQNISIDGKVLQIGATGTNNFETTANLMAGQHTLKYQLKNGYSGTATLKLQSSDSYVTISGLNFEISGDEITTTYLQLEGITGGNSEASDQDLIDAIKENTKAVEDTKPTNNEWTVSTILLCVLTVLLAVMVVVIILRLNRK